MSLERVTRNAQARQTRVVVACPDSLRELADRLDAAAKAAREGDSVLVELSPSITLMYRPGPVYSRLDSAEAFDPKSPEFSEVRSATFNLNPTSEVRQ